MWNLTYFEGHWTQDTKDIPRFCEVIKNAMRCRDKDAAVIAVIGDK